MSPGNVAFVLFGSGGNVAVAASASVCVLLLQCS